jgi:hypothetical protein
VEAHTSGVRGDGFVALDRGVAAPGWIRQIRGPTGAGVSAVGTDDTGNVYLAGDLAGNPATIEFVPGNPRTVTGGTKRLVARYDADGDHRWAEFITGTGTVMLDSVAGRGDSVYVGGRFSREINLGTTNLTAFEDDTTDFRPDALVFKVTTLPLPPVYFTRL